MMIIIDATATAITIQDNPGKGFEPLLSCGRIGQFLKD